MSRVLTSRQTTSYTIERARQRAVAEGIEVRQVEGSPLWIASSGTDPHKAYVLNVVAGRVVDCTCQAGKFGGYCKHRAAWDLAQEAKEAIDG